MLYFFFNGCTTEQHKTNPQPTKVQIPFHLQGDIHGAKDGILKIHALASGTPTLVMDSVQVKGGKFSLKGDLKKITPVGLSLNDTYFIGPIFLEKGEINIDWKPTPHCTSCAEDENYTVMGTPSNETYQEYREKIKTLKRGNTNERLETTIAKINVLDTDTDTMALEVLTKEARNLAATMDSLVNTVRKQHVLDNPSSYTAPYILVETGSGFNQDVFSIAEMKSLFEAMNPALAVLENYKRCKEELDRTDRLSIGKKAPDFEFTYDNGEKSSLSGMRGTLVLLEFWAYWCGPCLDRFPALIQLDETYKNEHFQIMTIHDNTAEDIWTKAHKTMQLPWDPVHVMDTDSNPFSVWDDYNVNSLPTSYLIGKDGSLLARNPSDKIIRKHVEKALRGK